MFYIGKPHFLNLDIKKNGKIFEWMVRRDHDYGQDLSIVILHKHDKERIS